MAHGPPELGTLWLDLAPCKKLEATTRKIWSITRDNMHSSSNIKSCLASLPVSFLHAEILERKTRYWQTKWLGFCLPSRRTALCPWPRSAGGEGIGGVVLPGAASRGRYGCASARASPVAVASGSAAAGGAGAAACGALGGTVAARWWW